MAPVHPRVQYSEILHDLRARRELSIRTSNASESGSSLEPLSGRHHDHSNAKLEADIEIIAVPADAPIMGIGNKAQATKPR